VRRALISDIHGNIEALESVLEDIKAQGIREILCLGDIVGYGPNPSECIDRVMDTCALTLLGDHDERAISDRDRFKLGAEPPIFWTRGQLGVHADGDANQRRREFLSALASSYDDGSFLFVHGSPHNPLSEYDFPEDVYNRRKIERLFALFDGVCLHGHTHVPGIITEDFQFFAPEDVDMEYALGERKAMVDVGSVGQPRDGDVRACYVILEDGRSDEEISRDSLRLLAAQSTNVIFRRVPYDFKCSDKSR
jgi:predicted phosphodiesterase